MASISAVVKQGGHDVKLYHMLYMPSKEEFIEKVKSFSPTVVGITARTTAIPFIKDFCRWLKEELPDLFVTIGGYHAILVPDEVLAIEGCDAVCVGEGEYPLLELLDSFQNGELKTDIQSINFKLKDGTIIKNPVRPLIEDLDELPFPDFDLFDYPNLDRSKNFTAMVMLSRGGLFSCTYCSNNSATFTPIKRNIAVSPSPKKAIELLELLLKKYPFIQYINSVMPSLICIKTVYEFMPIIEKIHRRLTAISF